MKKSFLPLATLLLAPIALAGCGGNAPSEPVRPIATFALGEKGTSGAGFDLFSSYQLNFYKQNVYEFISTQITFGYNMNLGTTVSVAYGTYVNGNTEDGVSEYVLNKAADVVLSSYSLAGGYKIQVNTANEAQTYPTELPAQTQGEQRMANSKEDVIDAYGLGTNVYVSNHIMSFADPNASGEQEKTVVRTASGSVASVLNRKFKKVQVVSDIKDAAVGKLYQVDYAHIFDDNSYEYITTGITFGYGMVLGTTNSVAFGKGAFGTGEDGYTPFNLEKADDVALNAYSLAGGFSFAINTSDATQTYPTELPAQTQGEQRMANSKDDVINAYGAAHSIFTSDADCVMSMTNPNA